MSDIEKIIELEKKLLAYDGPDRIVHFTEYLDKKAEENLKTRGFRSGFEAFDDKLNGLTTCEVTVITGRTGDGKTLFAESWVRKMMQTDPEVKCVFFSFEVSPFNVMAKYSDTPETPIFLPLELEAMNIDWLIERIREAKIKHACQIFVLDHLHYVVDMAQKLNMSLNIGAFMRKLKLAANEMNISILLLAHQDKGERGQDASLDGIRDSTFIAQEADNVIVVFRRKDFESNEIEKMDIDSRIKITQRQPAFFNPQDPNAHCFAIVQIAKARRAGTYRWPKLFQKVGHYLEEV